MHWKYGEKFTVRRWYDMTLEAVALRSLDDAPSGHEDGASRSFEDVSLTSHAAQMEQSLPTAVSGLHYAQNELALAERSPKKTKRAKQQLYRKISGQLPHTDRRKEQHTLLIDHA